MIPNPLMLNRSRIQIQNEQIWNLYRRLYWYIVQDFRHCADCEACHIALAENLSIFMVTTAVHSHEALGQGPSAELAAIGDTAAAANEAVLALVPPKFGPIAISPAFLQFGGGFDEHAAALLIANMGFGGAALGPPGIYAFTCRNIVGLIPDPVGTAVADIALNAEGALTGEASQPFSIDLIGEILKPVLG